MKVLVINASANKERSTTLKLTKAFLEGLGIETIRRLPLIRTVIMVIIVLYSLRALAGGWACVIDFRWLQCVSSFIPAFIAWCYYPGLKSK